VDLQTNTGYILPAFVSSADT